MEDTTPMLTDLCNEFRAGTLPKQEVFECYFTEGHQQSKSMCWIYYEMIEKLVSFEGKSNGQFLTTH